MSNKFTFKEWRKSTETDQNKALTAQQLSEKFAQLGYPNLTRNRITSLENKSDVVPNRDELKAYCEYFNTTSDHLLGIRRTKSKNENLVMIEKVTGLSDDAIKAIKKFPKEWKQILSYMYEDGSIELIMEAVTSYFPNAFNASEKDIMNKIGFEFNRFLALEKMRDVLDNIHGDMRIYNILLNNYEKEYIKKVYDAVPEFQTTMSYEDFEKKVIENSND